MEKVLLNKTECLFLKGIAIIFIILHNYCHEFPSAIEANEFLWIKGNIISFYNHLIHPSYFIISDFFSFWGHYGIVIFLFISGYGLVMKYERTSVPHVYKTFDFIKKHYIKLLSLMIWGFIANILDTPPYRRKAPIDLHIYDSIHYSKHISWHCLSIFLNYCL